MSDLLAIALSFVYVFGVLAIAELLRKRMSLPVDFTRKVVHVSVGMWSWGTVALFQDKLAACIPPAAFIVLNWLSYRRGTFAAMETGDRGNLGTVYFPMAFVAAILLFWDVSRGWVVAALMPMTWGDAFAAVVGKRFGKRRYSVLGATRTLEGSVTMFTFSFAATVLALAAFGAGLPGALLVAALVAAACTLAESVSPFGLDNLVVPAAAAATLVATGGWVR